MGVEMKTCKCHNHRVTTTNAIIDEVVVDLTHDEGVGEGVEEDTPITSIDVEED